MGSYVGRTRVNLIKSIGTFCIKSKIRRILRIEYKRKNKKLSRNLKHLRNRRKNLLFRIKGMILLELSRKGISWHKRRNSFKEKSGPISRRRNSGKGLKLRLKNKMINLLSMGSKLAKLLSKGRCYNKESIKWNLKSMQKGGLRKNWNKVYFKWVLLEIIYLFKNQMSLDCPIKYNMFNLIRNQKKSKR